jgi:hypothetical protein
MKKTILALMLAATSIEAQSAFTAYYPLENYKDTGGALPPGSIVFKPDPIVTPPDPVDPVEPVNPEPTEEEKKTDCYKKISGIVGDFGFNTDAAVKEYENGTCAVDLAKIPLNPAYTRYLHEYVNMVISFGNAGIMPSFNFTHNVDYNASGSENYQKHYNRMINAIKTSELYANVLFTPQSSYRSRYKGYKIYTIISNCESALKKYIDDGFSDYYFGTQTLKGGCEGRWNELFKDMEFIKTTK